MPGLPPSLLPLLPPCLRHRTAGTPAWPPTLLTITTYFHGCSSCVASCRMSREGTPSHRTLTSGLYLGQRDSDGSGRHSCKCNYADTVWVCPAPMLTQFECARRLCLHCSLSLSEPGPYADTVCVKPGPPCWHKFKVETMKQSKISSFSNKTVTMGYEQRQPTFPPTQI